MKLEILDIQYNSYFTEYRLDNNYNTCNYTKIFTYNNLIILKR